MENLQQNLENSEKTVVFLQQQLAILTKLAANQQQSAEVEEVKRISAENELLKVDLKKLKQDLRFYEVQNGILQVPLPETDVTSVALTTAEVETTVVHSTKHEKSPQKTAEEQDPKGSKKKNKGKPKETGQSAPTEDKLIDASRLNMKVGKIISVKKHPDAETLFIEEVDLGEEKHRTIVSGLVKHYTLEQMQDHMGIFLCNLKPAKMRGVLSEGMIMCASSPEKIEILDVPCGSVVGEKIICEGYPGEPDNQLNPKKKIWEQIQPDLRVGADGIPGYKGGAFTVVGKGTCSAPTMRECIIK